MSRRVTRSGRIGPSLLALLVLGAASVMGTGAQTNALPATKRVAATAEGSPNEINKPSDLRLKKSANNQYIDDVEQDLAPVPLANVLANANRSASRCTPPNTANVVIGFCWNSSDESTTSWKPQGITTSADANASGTWGNTTTIMVSWHNADGDKGARLSIVDWSDPSAPKYRLALLVVPAYENGHATLKAIPGLHAGGIMWYGNLLYVADRDLGLRVFDLNHVWHTAADSTKSLIGYQNGDYYAYGFRYVIPELFRYVGSVEPGSNKASQRFSFVSLDRSTTPDTIVTGEFGGDKPGRVTRYQIDYTNRLLKTGADGYARATYSVVTELDHVQGATSIDNRFYMTVSHPSARSDLVTYRKGDTVLYRDSGALPRGIEDVSYWPDRDQLWTQTEATSARYVFALRKSAL